MEIKIKFNSPSEEDAFALPVGGCYIPETKTIFIYCRRKRSEKNFIREIELIISHETLHPLIHSIAGEKATLQFDLIHLQVYDWDKTTHSMLY